MVEIDFSTLSLNNIIMFQSEKGVNCDMGPQMVTNLWSVDSWDADRCEGCKYDNYCYEMYLKISIIKKSYE